MPKSRDILIACALLIGLAHAAPSSSSPLNAQGEGSPGPACKTNAAIAPNWSEKPVEVNVQVDLTRPGDQDYVSPILAQVESRGWKASVFVTGQFATDYPYVVHDVQSRGHEVGVSGWTRGEDLTSLDYTAQLQRIDNALKAVRRAVANGDAIADFKFQGNRFNHHSIQALQALGMKSVSGVFFCGTDFPCECDYAQSIGRITFPYPVTNSFWAIPISVSMTDVPLQADPEKKAVEPPSSLFEYSKLLAEKYAEAQTTKDPVVISLDALVVGSDASKLTILSRFLDQVRSTGGKVAPVRNLILTQGYVTNLNISGPNSASVDEQVSIAVGYASTLYCPKYRFHAYGKYPGQDWSLLDSWQHCFFVSTGSHSFDIPIRIPPLPQWDREELYTVRVASIASFGSCDASDPGWPTPDSYEAMAELQIQVKPDCKIVPPFTKGDNRFDLLFVPDGDYAGQTGTTFVAHVQNLINTYYGATTPIAGNLSRFNFWYTEKLGDAQSLSLPENLRCTHIAAAIIHRRALGDRTSYAKIFTAEGENPGATSPPNSFIHESGHAIFDLSDEYEDQSIPPAGSCTAYRWGNVDPFNIWDSELSCRNNAQSIGWDPNECSRFCNPNYPCCGTSGWWRVCEDPPEIMVHNTGGFGRACRRRINEVLGQYPGVGPKAADDSIKLSMNFATSGVTILDTELIHVSPPIYVTEQRDFLIRVISFGGQILGEYSFRDPRALFGEYTYEGATYLENVDFSMTIPHFDNGQTVEVRNAAGALLASADISALATGTLSGTVVDASSTPIGGARVLLKGALPASTTTGSDGQYSISPPIGSYEVVVDPSARSNAMGASQQVTIQPAQTTTLDYTLTLAGSISGIVTDTAGTPVQGARLYLTGHETPRYSTDTAGDYIVPKIPAGSVEINIDAPGLSRFHIFVNDSFSAFDTKAPVDVTLGQTSLVDFRMLPDFCSDANEPNNFVGQATPIPEGASAGSIVDICGAGDIDYYSFAANAGDYITADVDAENLGSSLDSYLILYDGNGTSVLAQSNDYDGHDSYIDYIVPVRGTYFLMVRAASHPAVGGAFHFYKLKLDRCPDPHETNNEWQTASAITYGSTLTSSAICPAGDVDYYAFAASAGDPITAEVTAQLSGSHLDSYLYLYDSDGSTILATDDDSGYGYDSLLHYTLSTGGTYYLKVRDYSSQEGGSDYFYGISLSAPWHGAVVLDGGWRWLAWLGFFNVNSYPWIYHNELGWLYATGMSAADLSWYYPKMGSGDWLWTSSTVFPWMYRHSDSSWLYFLPGSSNPSWFFNGRTGSWEAY